MQEEVENRAVTLIISGVKLTARELKAAIEKYLANRKAQKQQGKASVKPTGKQTVKQLVGQNQGVSNIEVTESNIKGFDRVARKYGVDYAVKRVKGQNKYLVFFKSRDADAITSALKEYTQKKTRDQNRPSLKKMLKKMRILGQKQQTNPEKHKHQERSR